MVQLPSPQLLSGASAEVSVHQLGATLGAEMEQIFPDAPRGHTFLAAITFQFPCNGIDLTLGPGTGHAPQASRIPGSQRDLPSS